MYTCLRVAESFLRSIWSLLELVASEFENQASIFSSVIFTAISGPAFFFFNGISFPLLWLAIDSLSHQPMPCCLTALVNALDPATKHNHQVSFLALQSISTLVAYFLGLLNPTFYHLLRQFCYFYFI